MVEWLSDQVVKWSSVEVLEEGETPLLGKVGFFVGGDGWAGTKEGRVVTIKNSPF